MLNDKIVNKRFYYTNYTTIINTLYFILITIKNL